VISCSHTTGYAIEALAFLAGNQPQSVTVREIATTTGIPLPYLSKLFQRLSEAGIVETKRGYKGGVRLLPRPETLSLLRISEAVENTPGNASDHDCARPGGFREAFRQSCRTRLSSMTLAEAVEFEIRHQACLP
jgi:Rrf2 family protein